MIHIVRKCKIRSSPRVKQLQGMFDVAPAAESVVQWDVSLDVSARPWNIGLIVGPSGTGKSTILRECFGAAVVNDYDWPADGALIDGFPAAMSIRDITQILSSVGFSSPPSWLRPFGVLSNGEQFRATMARALAENTDLAAIDEFTSVVDRTVAQIGSHAIAKTVRARAQKLVAASCHYDIIEWMQPDWIYEPHTGKTHWRSLQPRPNLELDIAVGGKSDWPLFKPHHYLSGAISPAAHVFIGSVNGRPAALTAVQFFPHPSHSGWREHRAVVLPDFQGMGIGNRMSEFIASAFKAVAKHYRGTTGHPAFIQHRLRSPLWRVVRRGSLRDGRTTRESRVAESERLDPALRRSLQKFTKAAARTAAVDRITWSFEYIGPPNPDAALALGLKKPPETA